MGPFLVFLILLRTSASSNRQFNQGNDPSDGGIVPNLRHVPRLTCHAISPIPFQRRSEFHKAAGQLKVQKGE